MDPTHLSEADQLRQLQLENESLYQELRHIRAVLETAEKTNKALGGSMVEHKSYTFHPECPVCDTRLVYYVGFRGRVLGNIFGGRDEISVQKRTQEQDTRIQPSEIEIPDHLPEEI